MRLKSVLITGAQGSLGTAVVKRFLEGGMEVIGVDVKAPPRNPDDMFSKVTWLDADLSRADSVRGLVTELGSKQVDALVHCAGGFRHAPVDETSDDDLGFLMNVNLLSAFHLVREFLPGMKARGFGRLTFISSRST